MLMLVSLFCGAGERISISWRVRNIGLGVTATDQWTDRIHLSTDNQLGVSHIDSKF